MFQSTILPPHRGHQITGTMVDELWPSLVVVSNPLVVVPLPVIKSVENLSGIVVIVAVGTNDSELSVVDPRVLCDDCDIGEVEDPETIVGVFAGVGVSVGVTVGVIAGDVEPDWVVSLVTEVDTGELDCDASSVDV